MIWVKGAILGAAVWIALRAIRKLSAAERFQIWALYLFTLLLLPYAQLPGFALVSISTPAIARAAMPTWSFPNLFWPIAAYFLFRHFAAWQVWRRARKEGQIRYSDEISSPVACAQGILLPLDAKSWSESRLTLVLRHEQAHLNRYDVLWDLLASLAVAALWWQPFAWLALYRMRREREWAADDQVLETLSNPFEYAETIYEFAAKSTLQPAMAGSGRGHLEQRMKHLLNTNAPRRRANWLTATIATLSFCALLSSIAVAQDKNYDVAPKVILKVEPQYTDGARDRKASGTVVLSVRIDTDGLARDMKVIRTLDQDLDVQAMSAVEKWRFEPGKKDGTPVPVKATIEVNFRRE